MTAPTAVVPTAEQRLAADGSSRSLRIAVGAAAVSAGVHLWVAPEHLSEWWLYGAFFAVTAGGQAALAWLLLRSARLELLLAGIAANVLLVGVYVTSRTVGLPLVPPHSVAAHLPVAGGIGNGVPIYPGLGAGHVEAVGRLDVLALAAELTLIAMLVDLLPPRSRSVTTSVMLVLGAALWVAVLLTSVW